MNVLIVSTGLLVADAGTSAGEAAAAGVSACVVAWVTGLTSVTDLRVARTGFVTAVTATVASSAEVRTASSLVSALIAFSALE